MKLITCPDTLVYPSTDYTPTIFMGGGISNCANWQKEMAARFSEIEVTLINPRRVDFDITDPSMSEKQIKWEHEHLSVCDATMFWFPFETLCPITLFELAKQAALGKKIFVGCHPAYQRKFDVEHQLKLMRPEVVVHSSFRPMVNEITNWARMMNRW